ncbi:MAG TPA: outer membrane beta-barrel protein [Polyangiales bacterium]
MHHWCLARAQGALRPYALALVATLSLTPSLTSVTLAQDEAPAAEPAGRNIDNEMPPEDAPRPKKQDPTMAPPAAGSIKDSSDQRRHYSVSLQAAFPWLYSLAGGFRVSGEIPILHNGFIPSINDSFSLEPLFELTYGRPTNTVFSDSINAINYTPALSILWSFYFKTNLRAYANLTLGYTIVDDDYPGPGELDLNHFHHNFSVGAFYDFHPHWSVRGEIGYAGMRAGIAYLI